MSKYEVTPEPVQQPHGCQAKIHQEILPIRKQGTSMPRIWAEVFLLSKGARAHRVTTRMGCLGLREVQVLDERVVVAGQGAQAGVKQAAEVAETYAMQVCNGCPLNELGDPLDRQLDAPEQPPQLPQASPEQE